MRRDAGAPAVLAEAPDAWGVDDESAGLRAVRGSSPYLAAEAADEPAGRTRPGGPGAAAQEAADAGDER